MRAIFVSAPLFGHRNSTSNRSNIVHKYRYNGMTTIKKINSFVCYIDDDDMTIHDNDDRRLIN